MRNALTSAEERALAEKFSFGLEQRPRAPRTAGGELSEEDLQAIDLAYHQKKTDGTLDRERQHQAVEDQVQMLRCKGAL